MVCLRSTRTLRQSWRRGWTSTRVWHFLSWMWTRASPAFISTSRKFEWFLIYWICIVQSYDSESIESRTLLRHSGQFAFSLSHWSMHFLWNKWSHVSKSLTWSPDVNSPKQIGQLPSSPVFFVTSSAFNFLVFSYLSSCRVSPCCSNSCTSN